MNAVRLSEFLINNKDGILTILESLDFTNIQYNSSKNEFRFAREEGRNPSSVRLNLDTLLFKSFSTNEKGNIYTLVMMKKGYTYFPNSLNYVANLLGLEKDKFDSKINYPFGGFYKDLVRESQEPEYTMETYDETILETYLHKYNAMFFNDGINYQTQEKFKVGFDLETCRITIPEYTLDGKLCGVMGRSIWSQEPHESRWIPIIPCSRSLTLYGYHQNYKSIQEKGMVVIGESEKFPQQLDSFDCNIGLATCGNSISPVQEKYIKGLLVPKIILGYDDGLEEEYVREQAKKLKVNTSIYTNSVGYIWDGNNEILLKGNKMSPSDVGKKGFMELVKRKVVWI